MIKVFVYGTLKKGGLNHFIINRDPSNNFIGKDTIVDYTLYGSGLIPFAIKSPGKYIQGEVYKVSMETFSYIERLELGAGYQREVTEDGIIFYSYPIPYGKKIGSMYNVKQKRPKKQQYFYAYE